MKLWNAVHTVKMQRWFNGLVEEFGQTNDICKRGKVLIEVDTVLKRWWPMFLEQVGITQGQAEFMMVAELQRRNQAEDAYRASPEFMKRVRRLPLPWDEHEFLDDDEKLAILGAKLDRGHDLNEREALEYDMLMAEEEA
jgi:hypothetical protein